MPASNARRKYQTKLAKHVGLAGEDFRTWVRFPPPPPIGSGAPKWPPTPPTLGARRRSRTRSSSRLSATRSPSFSPFGRRRFFPKQSADSHTGPTTSKRPCLSALCTDMISWCAWYNEGRRRSFIAASSTANFFLPCVLTASTRASSMPELPAMNLPGSTTSWHPCSGVQFSRRAIL